MQYSLVLTMVFIAASIGVIAPSGAAVGVGPGAAALVTSHGSFARVGWRRNYGYGPGPYAAPQVVVVPQAAQLTRNPHRRANAAARKG